MTTTRIAIASALAAALVLPVAAQAQGNMEKCYGISKAGKNDCQTANVFLRRNLQEGCADGRLDLGAQGRLREDRRRQARRQLIHGPVAGIGLRSPHLAEIGRDRPATGFLEIHAENHLGGSPARQAVERLRDDYDFSIHAVGLSLAVERTREAHLGARRALVKRLTGRLGLRSPVVERCIGGRYFNDLLPLP